MIKLDKRLKAISELVPIGAYVADVGTDHAYLPIYLIENGIARKALASDINRGPLERARENIAACGMEEKIDTCLTPGLENTEGYPYDTVMVAGMGGEVIFGIINCSIVKKRKPTLILQPMSSIEDLSHLLAREGFFISEDKFVKDGKRLYRIMKCHYDGKPYDISELEAHIGGINLQRRDELTLLAVKALIEKTEKIAKGNPSDNIAKALICQINEYLNNTSKMGE